MDNLKLIERMKQAVARGWCHPATQDEVLNEELANAITAEVVMEVNKMLKEENICIIHG